MKEFLSNTFKGDVVLWVVFGMLIVISSVEMYSASSSLAYKQANYFMPVWSHITFLVVGFWVAYLIHLMPLKFVLYVTPLLYIFALVFMVVALFSGQSINEAARWTRVMGIQFQPSELGKLSLILSLSVILKQFNQELYIKRKVAFVLAIVFSAIVIGLIFPENFSTATLCVLTAGTMMFYARVPLMWLGKLVGGALLLLAMFSFLSYFSLLPDAVTHRTSVWTGRLGEFFNKEEVGEKTYSIDEKNYQASHAKIAISNSKYIGRGPGNSIERDFLPQAFADFIYAIIIEEWGIFGAVTVLLLYLIMFYRAIIIARSSDNIYRALLVLGLSTMILYQAFINMAVAVGLMPVTGQPLPLISRGGTSIVITSAYFGLMLGVSRINELKRKEKVKNE